MRFASVDEYQMFPEVMGLFRRDRERLGNDAGFFERKLVEAAQRRRVLVLAPAELFELDVL